MIISDLPRSWTQFTQGLLAVVRPSSDDTERQLSNFLQTDPLATTLSRIVSEYELMGKPSKTLSEAFSDSKPQSEQYKNEIVQSLIQTSHFPALRWLIEEKNYQFSKSDLLTAIDTRDEKVFDLILDQALVKGLRVSASVGIKIINDSDGNNKGFPATLDGYQKLAAYYEFAHATERLKDLTEANLFKTVEVGS